MKDGQLYIWMSCICPLKVLFVVWLVYTFIGVFIAMYVFKADTFFSRWGIVGRSSILYDRLFNEINTTCHKLPTLERRPLWWLHYHCILSSTNYIVLTTIT